MGAFLSRLSELFDGFRREPVGILMVGLDAAGKTTLLYKLKLNEVVKTIPTVGYNVETVTPVKGVTFTLIDVGCVRMMDHYYKRTEGVLLVVDSADKERLSESREELKKYILEQDEMREKPLIVLANKQDLPEALSTSEIVDLLELSKIRNRKWRIYGTCATTGDGVIEAMKEMANLVKDFKRTSRCS